MLAPGCVGTPIAARPRAVGGALGWVECTGVLAVSTCSVSTCMILRVHSGNVVSRTFRGHLVLSGSLGVVFLTFDHVIITTDTAHGFQISHGTAQHALHSAARSAPRTHSARLSTATLAAGRVPRLMEITASFSYSHTAHRAEVPSPLHRPHRSILNTPQLHRQGCQGHQGRQRPRSSSSTTHCRRPQFYIKPHNINKAKKAIKHVHLSKAPNENVKFLVPEAGERHRRRLHLRRMNISASHRPRMHASHLASHLM